MSLSEKKMIFITGASRSGTTLMSFVLRNHSEIFGLKELQYFGEFWDPRGPEQKFDEHQALAAAASIFARQKQGILAAKRDRQDMESARLLLDSLAKEDRSPDGLFAAAVHQLSSEAGKSIPCEQTPRNIFYAEALLQTYPGAHVIHMMRDPRAVMASQKQRWKRRRLATDKAGFPRFQSVRAWVNYHPYTVAKLWCRASQEAQRLSEHPRFTLIRFEDLLEAPERTIRALCDRLGIEFEPSMLEVGQINSSHQSSVGGARKGLHKDAINQWQTKLSGVEAAIAERVCDQSMARYAYKKKLQKFPGGDSELRYKLTYLLHVAGVLAVNPRRAWIQLQAALRNVNEGKLRNDTKVNRNGPKTGIIGRGKNENAKI